MGIRSLIMTVFFCLFAIVSISLCVKVDDTTFFINANSIVDAETAEMVGVVDGRAYFLLEGQWNWSQAEEACKVQNMRLGSITTTSQYTLLSNYAKSHNTTRGHYWTAGRDAAALHQFTWNSTGTQVSSTIGIKYNGYHIGETYQTCLTMWFNKDGTGNDGRETTGLHSMDCEQDYGALCENR